MKQLSIIILFLFIAAGSLFAQVKKRTGFLTTAVDNGVIVQYDFAATSGQDKVNIILYRGNEKNENVKAIHQLNNLLVSSAYYYIDSTLPTAGTYQYTIEIISNGNTVVRESSLAYAYPASLAPFVKAFDAIAKKGSNEIVVSWNIANPFLAGNISLVRSPKQNEGFVPIANLKNGEKTFTDKVDEANEAFFYRLQVSDIRKNTLIYSPVIQVLADYTIVPAAPQNIIGIVKNGLPLLSWEAGDKNNRGFYIYKKGFGERSFIQASSFIGKGTSSNYSWTDTSKSMKPGQSADYYILSESNSYTKSKSSDTVSISTENDKAMLVAPTELSIIATSDSTITLTWETDSINSLFINNYTVYQKNQSDRDYQILRNGIVDASINYLSIGNPEDGTSYMVKAKWGTKESAASLPVEYIANRNKQSGPAYLKGEIVNDVLIISWQKPTTTIIKEYRLYKWQGKDYSLVQTIGKDSDNIEVRNYKPGEKNQYILTTVNTKGIENTGTKPLTIF